MTDRIVTTATPIHSIDELVARFRDGAKPRAAWRIGAEHEKIGVFSDGTPVPYHGERGIAALFARLHARGWNGVVENGELVALARGG
jgi:glutamate--cysteine ligase